MNLEDLKKPFPAGDIEWRVQSCGISNNKPWALVLAYINARAVMDRLDEVVGSENWQVSYTPSNNGFICSLGIKIGNEWVWKSDGADQTDFEPFKGGISGALKRAANAWGIGRYLYNLKETFADCSLSKAAGYKKAKTKDQTDIYWKEPILPDWALPKSQVTQASPTIVTKDNVEVKVYLTAINSQKKLEELEKYIENNRETFNKLPSKERNEIKAAYQTKKASLQ